MSIWTIARKEWQHQLNGLLGYLFCALFVGATAYPVFFSQSYGNVFLSGVADLRAFFGAFPFTFSVFIPALAMRSWAEERRLGTVELLLSYGLPEGQLVLGKFLGQYGLIVLSLALTLPVPILVGQLAPLDWGQVLCGYLGALFFAAASLSLCQFLGTFSQHQILAFLLCSLAMTVLLMVESTLLNFAWHFQNVARGVLDSRDLVFYALFCLVFLFASRQTLITRFWSRPW